MNLQSFANKSTNQNLYFRLKPFCKHNETYEWEIKPSIDMADVKEPTQQQRTNSHQPQSEQANSNAVYCDSQVIEQDNQKKENNATMPEYKKIDRWADKLLDTGKRNNLMNFRDSKASTAEVVFPDCEKVFSKCSLEHVFEVYDPKIQVDDIEEENEIKLIIVEAEEKLNKEDFRKRYSSRLKGDKYLLVYAQTPNPMTAVKNIAKKAKTIQDETGVNVAYLAFGLLKWNEKEGSEVFFRAPLLLVHINLITGSVVDPVKIEIADDDVLVNPTFNYFLQADFGLTLPEYEDGETLSHYYKKVSDMVSKLGWEVLNECKIGNFSFLKINMYEDLKNNGSITKVMGLA